MDQTKAAWTVMVYLAGDNNLTSECMFALTEMKEAVLGKEINVIAQFDPSDPYLPTHRYEINKRAKGKHLFDDIIDCARFYKRRGEVNFQKESTKANSLAKQRRDALRICQALEKASFTHGKTDNVVTDDTDTASPVTLYNFISFCITNYPAHRYMVVLSGHAAGTERDYLLKDESSARSLTFNELKQVFKRVRKDLRGKPIDIVGMDNCLMSMAEICYQLRGLAEVVVGCESFSPSSGWPYRQILERLSRDFSSPRLSEGRCVNHEAARAIVDEYVNYYSTYWISGLSVTQSALDITKVERLHTEVDKLAQAMERELIKESGTKLPAEKPAKQRPFANALLLAHWETQSYNGEQFVDLYDFCDCLQKRVSSKPVLKQCERLKKFIENDFVLKSCYSGAAYQYSYGVSLYFPWAQIAPSYWNLDFVADQKRNPGWGSFLQAYTELTRRTPRNWSKVQRPMSTGDINIASPSNLDHRMINDRMINDRMIHDRMGVRTRIHSMRNPPDVFVPDPCVKDSPKAMRSQRFLRVRCL